MSFSAFPEPQDDALKGIFFHNEDIDFEIQKPDLLSSWLYNIIEAENGKPGTINFIFCSDPYLLKINQKYLDHDYFTDIITFQQSDVLTEGDIFISIHRVKDNAAGLEISFDHELHRVMAHGVLHLLGYKDKSPDEKIQMRAKEDWALNIFEKHKPNSKA